MLAQPIVAQTYFYLRDRASRKLYPLTRAAESIGRGIATLTFPEDKKLSRLHCRIYRNASGLIVCDMGSRNKTYLNEKALPARTKQALKAGDVLRVGDHIFDVVVKEFKPKAASPSPAKAPKGPEPRITGAAAIPGRALELSIPAKPRSELGLPKRPQIVLHRAPVRRAVPAAILENLLILLWVTAFSALGLFRRDFDTSSFREIANLAKFGGLEVFVPALLLGLSLKTDTGLRVALAAVMSLVWVYLCR